MTSYSSRQIDDTLDAFVALARKEGKGKGEEKLFAVEILVQRFRRALERDKAGTAIPDGYPRGSGFDGSGGGMQHEVAADRWEGESRIALTSVELAIEQRVFEQRKIRDHHHDLVLEMIADAVRAVKAVDDLRSKLARIDNLIDTNPDASAEIKGCRSHARLKDGLGRSYYQPIAREDGARDGLCRWCYGWVADHEGQLPDLALVERFIRNGRVTSRDIEETRRSA